jgi:hypothetical protein
MSLTQRYEKFFKALNLELAAPLTMILTGGAAAYLFGGNRPTLDIDFAVQSSNPRTWDKDAESLNRLSAEQGLPIQYGEDISRWSMISLLDWREHTLPYKKYEKLEVRLMHPRHWSIGKISRGLDTDFEDLEVVLKKKKLKYQELIPFWAEALRASEPSSERFLAKKLIEEFLKTRGSKIWGKVFNKEKAVADFQEELAKK